MKKVAVVYYSRTGFTGKMAEGIAEGTPERLERPGAVDQEGGPSVAEPGHGVFLGLPDRRGG